MKKRTAVFGGSFDPPHLGHRSLILGMNEKLGFDRILIIPAGIPPHKTLSGGVSDDDRLAMCELTFFEPVFEVSDIEIRRPERSYTFVTLTGLKKAFPDEELYFVMGSDMLLSLHKWYRPDDILSLARLCVNARDDVNDRQKLIAYAEEFYPESYADGRIIITDSPVLELSSTQVRQTLREKGDAGAMLEEKTLEYIRRKGLYV